MAIINNIDLEALASAKTAIDPMIAEYESYYTAIYAALDTLRESYQGADSEKFAEQLNGFKNDFENLRSLLNDYSAEIDHIRSTYETMQADLANQASMLNAGN